MKSIKLFFPTMILILACVLSLSQAKGQSVVPSSVSGIEVLKPVMNANYVYVGQVPQPIFKGDLNSYFNQGFSYQEFSCKQLKLLLNIDSLGKASNPKIISVCGNEYFDFLQQMIRDMPVWTPANIAGKNTNMDILLNFEVRKGQLFLIDKF